MNVGICVCCGGRTASPAREAAVRSWARQLSIQARYPLIYRLLAGLPICAGCLDILPVICGDICQHCGRDQENSEGKRELCQDCVRLNDDVLGSNRSLLRYNEWGKSLLGLYKYRGDERLASFYGTLLAVAFFRYYDPAEFACITTVPLHNKRLYERGFNQVDLLATTLSRASGVPVRSLLQRTKETAKLSKQRGRIARQESMSEAFSWAGDTAWSMGRDVWKKPSKVLLIDDIYTTGSTLRSCATTLRAHLGLFCEIYSLTIYR